MSVEGLVKELRLLHSDVAFSDECESVYSEAADKLEELAAWNARLDRDLVDWTKKCFDAEAALAEAKRENEALKKALKKDPHSVWWRDYYEWLEARNAGGKDEPV